MISPEDTSTTVAVGTILGNKFRLDEKLGQGSFGMIFKCSNIEDQECYAIKLEKRNQKHSSMLVREIKVMVELKSEFGFARMISYGKDEDNNYVVMTNLGKNLDSILKKCGQRFTLATCMNIAEQMITRLEVLHKHNLIHRDIKPENFVIGSDRNFHMVYLIDFGLAKYYKDGEGKHIPPIEKRGMIGTARYASVNAHLGKEQSRRDDLEALGYVFIYFIKGKLPWQQVQADSKEEKYEKIKTIKMNSPLELICEGCPIEVVQYLRMVKKLEFTEQPNYTALKSLFRKVIIDRKLEVLSKQVDWETLPDYRYRKKQINPPELATIPSQKDIALRQSQQLEKQQLKIGQPQNLNDTVHVMTYKTDSAKRTSLQNNYPILDSLNAGQAHRNSFNQKVPSSQFLKDTKKNNIEPEIQPKPLSKNYIGSTGKIQLNQEVEQKIVSTIIEEQEINKSNSTDKNQLSLKKETTPSKKDYLTERYLLDIQLQANGLATSQENGFTFANQVKTQTMNASMNTSIQNQLAQSPSTKNQMGQSISNQNLMMSSNLNATIPNQGANIPVSLLNVGFQHGSQQHPAQNLLNVPNQGSLSQASSATSKFNHFSASDSDTVVDEGGIKVSTMIIDKNVQPLTTSEIRKDIRTRSLVIRQSQLELLDMHDHSKQIISLSNLIGGSILKMESNHIIQDLIPSGLETKIEEQKNNSMTNQATQIQQNSSKTPPKSPSSYVRQPGSQNAQKSSKVRQRSSSAQPIVEDIKEHQEDESLSHTKMNKNYKTQISPISEVKESTYKSLKTRPSFIGENITEVISEVPISINFIPIKKAFKKL